MIDRKDKYHQFQVAIDKYNTIPWYMRFEVLLSIAIILMQSVSVFNLFRIYTMQSIPVFVCTLLIAYFITDFINGLVHLLVDNNNHFTSIVGPFIAAFHLHHHTLRYKDKHPLKIYFYESGHKFWLVVYLLILIAMQSTMQLALNFNLGCVAFGIFSSLAEVSHYWCHKPIGNNKIIRALQKYRILLPLEHHRLHHTKDNMNYAFLNGLSDPLLNIVARLYCKGYKNRSDKYVNFYFKRQAKSSEHVHINENML